MEEIEAKVLDIDPERILAKAGSVEEIIQENIVAVIDENRLLRLRKENEKTILTLKKKKPDIGKIKVREEIEVELSDFENAKKIFLEIVDIIKPKLVCFRKVVKRFYIEGAKCELVWLENLPPYLEIEGTEEEIKRACRVLGIPEDKLSPLTVYDVFRKYNKEIPTCD